MDDEPTPEQEREFLKAVAYWMTDPYGQARTLSDFGEVTARWLEGELVEEHGGPDPETAELVPLLARMNRAGYITDFSQPGEPYDPKYGAMQRAAVGGHANEQFVEHVEHVSRVMLTSGLVVVAYHPDGAYDDGLQIPVTLQDDTGVTWIGGHIRPSELYQPEGVPWLHDDLLAALDGCWQLEIFDPLWGRNDLLWPMLERALDELPG